VAATDRPGPWLADAPQRVEEKIAGEIRYGQAIPFHPYETGLSTTVGNIHRTLAIDVHITGDKEGVCLGDHRPGNIVQPVEMLRGARRRIRQRHRTKLAQLNVLRAIAV
jgi:hypothetical protein